MLAAAAKDSLAARTNVRHGWPLALLLAALATLWPTFIDSAGPLHRANRSFDHITHHHLAVAKNLNLAEGLLGYYSRTVTDEGKPTKEVYNRFPPLGYVLIRLATATQGGDLAGEIQAGRVLMLALFASAALLAYLAMTHLTGRPWLALAATLAAFSSFAALRACDMVATEGVVDLFGTMLAFHGIARYRSGAKPRLGQLLAKACVALLLGWHVVGLIVAFVALGLAAAGVGRDWGECRRLALFGALTGLFALAVLTQNFAKEYFALQGQAALWELPSFRSALYRSTLKTGVAEHWPGFLSYQLHWIGLAFAPYAATRIDIAWLGWSLLGGIGLCTIVAAAAGIVLADRQAAPATRRQRQAASLALLAVAAAGPCYAVAMRGSFISSRYRETTWTLGDALSPSMFNGQDVPEAMFLVGLPLAAFSLLALLAHAAGRRPPRPRWRAGAAALLATLWLTFVASTFLMGRLGHDPKFAAQQRTLFSDLAAINRVAAGKRILAQGPLLHSAGRMRMPTARKRYYFTDSVLILGGTEGRFAEFAVGPRLPNVETLTPGNQLYFLYPIATFYDVCVGPHRADAAPGSPLDRWCGNA